MSIGPPKLYRGEPITRLNEHELADQRIQTQTVTIYTVEGSSREELLLDDDGQNFFTTPVEDLPGTVTEERLSMTPGFSSNIGTGMFFSWYNNEEPGLVFHFEREQWPELIEGEYTAEFADEYPGWMARVETLATGEVRYDGKFVGFVEDGRVNRWGQRARDRYSHNPSITREAEWFTYDTGLSVRRGLEEVVCYVHNGHGRGEIDSTLGWFDGYGYFGGGQTPKYMDRDEKLIALYEEVGGLMNRFSDRLRVVLLDGDVIRSRTKSVQNLEDAFVAAYDGVNVSDRVSGNRSLVGETL